MKTLGFIMMIVGCFGITLFCIVVSTILLHYWVGVALVFIFMILWGALLQDK